MAGIYEAIAEHVAESRASIDDKRFANWMSSIDDGGDRTFAKLDDAIDELVDRYREEVRDGELQS